MTELALPRRLRDITPEWLTEALRSSGALDTNGRVVSFEPRNVSLGLGFVGRCFALDLTYEPAAAGPARAVAKMPTTFGPSRAMADEMDLYRTEARFYSELAGRTPARTPRCFWTGLDPESGDFLLLMEDLGGLRSVSHDNGCSESDARASLSALARIHAAWWDSPELGASNWLKCAGDADDTLFLANIDSGWPEFLEGDGRLLNAAEITVLDRIRRGLPRLRSWLGESPLTLSHGDYRLENFFFADEPGGTEVVVLDWQLLAQGPPGRDLGYFLGWNLTQEQRRAWERDLVRFYYQELQALGAGSYTLDEAWDGYRLGLARLAILQPANATKLAEMNAGAAALNGAAAESMRIAMERGAELRVMMLRRALAAASETNACELLPA